MGNEKGFSLVEVITATVILSVLAAGIFAMSSFAKRMDIATQQKIIAMGRVEERMNQLKQQGASALPISTDTAPAGTTLCYSTGSNCVSYSELNGTMNLFISTIIKNTVPADPNAREVFVRADWADLLGVIRTQAAATFLQD